jgi:hypothetical protein
MPKLNDADEVFVGSVQADRIYAGSVLIWPNVEKWSPWYLVGTAPAAAPAAWFAAGINHYPSGHQRVYFRYSLNTGRLVVKGIASTSVALGYGAVVMTLNIDPNVLPRGTQRGMSQGLGSADWVGTWGGHMARMDIVNNATYHSDIMILDRTDTALPAGSWFTFETTWSFGDER